MATVRSGAVWHQLQKLFGLGTLAGLNEWELLVRYAERRDETAFEALVALHGAMVLGVCRRMLDDPADVEDAFQATFLVLIRKAGKLRPGDAVGPWLYGVARRVALRARSETIRKSSRERSVDRVEVQVEAPAGGDGMADASEVGPLLDRELGQLPAGYRAAIVLCYLEGRTHEEAARQLGWPLGTLKGRLSRARELLRDRLTRRGVTLSTGALTAVLAREAKAAVPAGWVEIINKAARVAASGEATAGVVPASAVALADGVLWAMKINQLKLAAATFAVLLTFVTGGAAIAYQIGQTRKEAPAPGSVVPRDETPNSPSPGVALTNDKTSRVILAQLDEPLTMSFPQETPLEDVLKYIKQSTQNEKLNLPSGIPIYVDPVGLQQAEKTMSSPIQLDLDGVPLRRTLTLILNQIDLRYYVADGVLFITSNPSGDKDPLSMLTMTNEPTALDILHSRAVRGELSAQERKDYIQLLKDLKEISKELRELEDTRRQQASPLPPTPDAPPSSVKNHPQPEQARPK
jgi:RNA polymerase sigma factor (sigma-70 family)